MGRQVDPNNLGQNHSQCIWKHKIIIPKEEPKQRLEKYSERFDNKENELVEGVFNPDTWGKRIIEEPKQETNLAISTTIAEIWYPTMELRFLEKTVLIDENYATTKMVLQQSFMNNFGKKEWRDIPTEKI
jgi:hypothetical protein